MPGLHRYEVAQGFQPSVMPVWGCTREEAIADACAIMRAEPAVFWSSDQNQEWQGPPTVWLQWRG